MINNILKQTISTFLELIEVRDSYTAGHSIRVAFYATELAKELKLSDEEIKLIHDAALLHDIGKIGIPDSILLKPENLSIEEYSMMQEHSDIGFKTIKSIEYLTEHAYIIKDHHENFDGSGYPDGKKGDEISIYSYILSLADSFDALTTSRIYKESKNTKEAVEILKKQDGKDFPLGLVSSLEKILLSQKIEKYKEQKPENKMEEEKYAFHFKDTLTGVFSHSYLNYFILENLKYKEYECVYYFNIKNMSLYNQECGWNNGDTLLKKTAKYLKKSFKNSRIFRVKGDDFIIISKNHIDHQNKGIIHQELFDSTCIKFDIHHFNFSDLKIDSLEKFEDIIFKQFGDDYYSEVKKKTIEILKDKNKTYEEKVLNINLDNVIKDFDLFNALITAQDKELGSLLSEKDSSIDDYKSIINLLPIACAILINNSQVIIKNKKFDQLDIPVLLENIRNFNSINIEKEESYFKYNDINFKKITYNKNNLLYSVLIEDLKE